MIVKPGLMSTCSMSASFAHLIYFGNNYICIVSMYTLSILKCTLLPRIQVHALIYIAEAKVHVLKWIRCNFLEVRKIHVLRIYLSSSIWRVVLDILVKSYLLLEAYKRKKTYKCMPQFFKPAIRQGESLCKFVIS